MIKQRYLALVAFAVIVSPSIQGDSVNSNGKSTLYENEGADWPGLCKIGKAQSPIALDDQSSTDVKNGFPLVFINYGISKLTAQTSQTTINLKLVPSYLKVGIAAGGLWGTYILAGAHFHWSAEHLLNNKRYDLELHLVHYNYLHGSIDEAIKHKHGLAVLGVFYTLGPENKAINQLMDLVKGKNVTLTPEDLLPPETNDFFRYEGSLTTPNCDESVIWTVFKTKNTISQEQLEWFRTLPINAGTPLENNYREIQKTRRRRVFHEITLQSLNLDVNRP